MNRNHHRCCVVSFGDTCDSSETHALVWLGLVWCGTSYVKSRCSWVVMPCGLVDGYQWFKRMCCLWLEGSSVYPEVRTERFPLNAGGPANLLKYMASHPWRFVISAVITLQGRIIFSCCFVFGLIVSETDSS